MNRIAQASRATGLLVAATAGGFLLSWLLGLHAAIAVSGLPAMLGNTALFFVLCGIAISMAGSSSRSYKRFGRGLAWVSLTLPALTLLEHLGDVDLGVDRLIPGTTIHDFFNPYPGRASLGTSFGLLALALGVVGLEVERLASSRVPQLLLGVSGIAGFLGISGYLFDSSSMRFNVGPGMPVAGMSPHAAVLLVLASGAALAAQPEREPFRLLTSRTPGGEAIRRLLPMTVIGPTAFWFITMLGHGAGFYGPGVALALATVTCTVFFSVALWNTANALNRIEAARASAEADLQQHVVQAQKMDSLGALAGQVAHDFRSALGLVIGNASVAQSSLPGDPDRAAKHLDLLLKAARRGVALTDRILSFARRIELNPSSVDVNALLRDKVEIARAAFPENIRFTMELDPELAPIHADSEQLREALLNLFNNSRDAMPDGGELRIRTCREPGYACIEVADTGFGMDEETRRKAFEPFFTTKGKASGTGLGLPMVYGIVRAHGGHIGLDSAPGKGSRFRIHLPQGKT